MPENNTETVKLPMGYTYKYTETKNNDGSYTKDKTPFFPYTKTSAVTDQNNVSLDIILEELRNFTGYPLTTDIAWDKPGVYALDASVGAKYYELCNKVFQSADSALTNLTAAIGISRNDDSNFSSTIAEMKNTLNNIRKEIVSKGGKCVANPTLSQVYDAIKTINNKSGTIIYEPFSCVIQISYNEFAKFPNCGVTPKYDSRGKKIGYYNNWRHLAFTTDFIKEHITSDKGFLEILESPNIFPIQIVIESNYLNYTKKNSYGTDVTYGIEKHYDSIFLEKFMNDSDQNYTTDSLMYPCIRYKVNVNYDTEKVSTNLYDSLATKYDPSYGHMIKFENYNAYVNDTLYKNMSNLMLNFDNPDYNYRMYHTNCENNPLIGNDQILLSFSFPTGWHTNCYNAAVAEGKYYFEIPLTSAEKAQWKAEPNIYFYISGYTKKN